MNNHSLLNTLSLEQLNNELSNIKYKINYNKDWVTDNDYMNPRLKSSIDVDINGMCETQRIIENIIADKNNRCSAITANNNRCFNTKIWRFLWYTQITINNLIFFIFVDNSIKILFIIIRIINSPFFKLF
jgi:hypothetical protein